MRRINTKLLFVGLILGAFIVCGGLIDKSDTDGLFKTIFFGPSNDLQININSVAPPNTNPKAQPDFDIFAWNTFIALNWPAISPDSSNQYLRGIPDLSRTFATAKHDDTLVWETFKEKREIFNQTVSLIGGPPKNVLLPWNAPVDYGQLREAENNYDPDGITTFGDHSTDRVFHQGQKQPFNAFDETTEVGSEIREDTLSSKTEKNFLLGRPCGPRVWKGVPSDSVPVLYEVKLNYDYYNYIKNNELYLAPTTKTNNEADLAELRLPYRTSAATGPKGQVPDTLGKYDIAVNYSYDAVAKQYRKINANPKPVDPPLTGAMQIKVAWIELDPATDDLSQYHTATALYYDSNEDGEPEAFTGVFGLIGMHIIQRIHISNNDGEAEPTGGTFVFATWEHTSIRKNAPVTGYTYSNYYNPAEDPAPPHNPATGDVYPQGFYPAIDTSLANDGVYPVPIVYDIIDNDDPKALGTAQVNKMVHDMLPEGSIWKNYQLVGTQFIAIDVNSSSLAQSSGRKSRYPVTKLDPQGIGLPVYLANLVIETNQGLQEFQGQPPGTTPIDNYLGAGVDNNSGGDFARGNTNTSFNRVAYNMGGCMGCHGVAQSKGFSFSFVLLGGRNGALTDTEQHFDVAPLDPVDDGN